MDQELSQLCNRMRTNASASEFIKALNMTKEVVANVRTPLSGIMPAEDNLTLRLCIIKVIDSLLLLPLSGDNRDKRQVGGDEEYQ